MEAQVSNVGFTDKQILNCDNWELGLRGRTEKYNSDLFWNHTRLSAKWRALHTKIEDWREIFMKWSVDGYR